MAGAELGTAGFDLTDDRQSECKFRDEGNLDKKDEHKLARLERRGRVSRRSVKPPWFQMPGLVCAFMLVGEHHPQIRQQWTWICIRGVEADFPKQSVPNGIPILRCGGRTTRPMESFDLFNCRNSLTLQGRGQGLVHVA